MAASTLASTTFRSLRIRNFRLFFVGQGVSLSGTWMQTIALGWLVLQLSHNSGFTIGFVIALGFLPTLLFGVWGGVIADRFDKRLVLIGTQAAMAVIAAVLAAITLAGVVELWMVYAIVVVNGFALAVDNPTRQTFVPEMVPSVELSNAISLNSVLFQLARILGPALAGVLIVAVGTGLCFLFNAISFVAVIGALLAIRPAELYRSAPVPREKGQVREGLRYIWETPELRSTLLMIAIVGTLAINFPVVLPLLAKLTFHGTAETYSWMTIAMGVGAIVGALVVASRARVSGQILVASGLGFGVAICAAAVAPTLRLFLGLLLLVGAGQIAFIATCNSLLQLRADPAKRGRVMAVYTIALLGSTPIGGPLVGWISEVWGPRWGLAVGGIATVLAVGAFGTVFVKARRRDEEVAVDERLADETALESWAVTRGASVAPR